MKPSSLFVVLAALWCCACSAPRVDGTSDDSLLGSLERVRTALPEDRRPRFDDSLTTISAAIESKVDFADVEIGAETMRSAMRRVLNGKTGDEIITYADDLKRGAQHLPEIAAQKQNSEDGPRPPLVVGESVDMSGNSFSRDVSKQFGETELRRLHADLNGPAARAKLQSYVCGPLPSFAITVVLWSEGPYQERLVRMQMTPPLYKDDGRIEAGIGYLFEHGVKTLDHGEPIDYGYRRPLDGTPIPPVPQDDPPEPGVADCQ